MPPASAPSNARACSPTGAWPTSRACWFSAMRACSSWARATPASSLRGARAAHPATSIGPARGADRRPRAISIRTRSAAARFRPNPGASPARRSSVMIDLALDGRLDGIMFRAAQQGGAARRRLEVQRRAPDVRAPDAAPGLLRRDERARRQVDVARDLARVAAHRARPDHARSASTMRSRSPTPRCAARDSQTPRIAVAALNPHGGEGGLFGREEIEIIAPAVAKAAARGIACQGPFPADTVFLKAFGGEFDGVLTMYHDQGQIATKLKGFNRGVTVTGGLATVFTTPAHGTAFDIVGKGIATTGALEQAVRPVRATCTQAAEGKTRNDQRHAPTTLPASSSTRDRATFPRTSPTSASARCSTASASRSRARPRECGHIARRYLESLGIASDQGSTVIGSEPARARALRRVRQRPRDPRRRLRRHAARGGQGSRLRLAHASDRAGAAAGAGARRARPAQRRAT